MIYLVLILAVVGIIYFVRKCYKIKYDTVIAFTGGLGSGKSLLSSVYAVKLYRKNLRKVIFYNIFHKKSKRRPLPQLYSTIPLRISRKRYSRVLTSDHLLLREKIEPRSVVWIDEIGSYASQFEYNNSNIMSNFDEFVRLFRHYTEGGYLIVNDQCSENIVLQVRRRLNEVKCLSHCKVYDLGVCKFYIAECRNIFISEEIKTVSTRNADKNKPDYVYGFIPYWNRYDTYVYSDRYSSVPKKTATVWQKLKTNRLLKVPKTKVNSSVKNEDI